MIKTDQLGFGSVIKQFNHAFIEMNKASVSYPGAYNDKNHKKACSYSKKAYNIPEIQYIGLNETSTSVRFKVKQPNQNSWQYFYLPKNSPYK
jgi:hypothetical protein